MQIGDAHAVVTGASRGFGRLISERLAARGARLTLIARNPGPLGELATELDAVAVAADLADRAQVDGLIGRAVAANGPVDVLVNNAGLGTARHFATLDETEIVAMHDVNLLAPMRLTRQVLPSMLERRRGAIVNISSMAASGGFPGLATYCATKAGLSHFTRILREDLAGTPVVVTAVEVGPSPTDMLTEVDAYAPTERSFARFRKLQLMPNVPPERVADATVRAIERGHRQVWLPRRAALFPLLTSLPQRIASPMLRGIERGA
jgi:short-subunit dehydrogenase